MEEKDFIKPDLCHEKALEEMKPSLAFSDNCDFEAYRAKVRKKYIELLGDMPEKVPANVCVEWEKDMGDFIEKGLPLIRKNTQNVCAIYGFRRTEKRSTTL